MGGSRAGSDCKSGKRQFTSETEAIRGMRNISATLRAYFCKDCHFWHMTKQNDRFATLGHRRRARRGERY